MAKDDLDRDIKGLSEKVIDGEFYFRSVDLQDQVDFLIRNLSWEDRLFLVQRYWKGWSIKKIAKSHNMKEGVTGLRLREIIEKIRKGIGNENVKNDRKRNS